MVFARELTRSGLFGFSGFIPLTPKFSEWVARIEPGKTAWAIWGGAKTASEGGLVAPICNAEFVGPVAWTGVVDESGIA